MKNIISIWFFKVANRFFFVDRKKIFALKICDWMRAIRNYELEKMAHIQPWTVYRKWPFCGWDLIWFRKRMNSWLLEFWFTNENICCEHFGIVQAFEERSSQVKTLNFNALACDGFRFNGFSTSKCSIFNLTKRKIAPTLKITKVTHSIRP